MRRALGGGREERRPPASTAAGARGLGAATRHRRDQITKQSQGIDGGFPAFCGGRSAREGVLPSLFVHRMTCVVSVGGAPTSYAAHPTAMATATDQASTIGSSAAIPRYQTKPRKWPPPAGRVIRPDTRWQRAGGDRFMGAGVRPPTCREPTWHSDCSPPFTERGMCPMRTLAQMNANRRNAQRSTGPTTPSGKATVVRRLVPDVAFEPTWARGERGDRRAGWEDERLGCTA